MQTRPTVYLLADDASFSKSVANLASSLKFDVRELTSVDQFLTEIKICHPGCVIVDLGKTSLDVTRLLDELSHLRLPLPMIALADERSITRVVRAARDGAIAILQHGRYAASELVEAIQTAIRLDDRQTGERRQRDLFESRMRSLSASEHETLRLLLAGSEIASIVSEMKVSRKTVEKYRMSLMHKLNVQSFPELIALFAKFERPGIDD